MGIDRSFVEAPENERAFRKMESIISSPDVQGSLFVFGEQGSGKSTLAQDVGKRHSTSSTKRVVVSHAAEIMLNIQNIPNESFLQDLATSEVLLLDDFQDFLEDGEAGVVAASALLHERSDSGKCTILLSQEPVSFFENTDVATELADFDIETIAPLGSESRKRFVEEKIAQYRREGKSPRLEDDAKSYLACAFPNLHDLELAIIYLMTASDLPDNSLATKQIVEELLSV